MKTIKFILTFFIVISMVFFFSCTPDETGPGGNFNFSANVDGNGFVSGLDFASATLELEDDNSYRLLIIASQYQDFSQGIGQTITIGMTGDNFDDLVDGTVFTDYNVQTGYGGFGLWVDAQSVSDVSAGSSIDDLGAVNINLTQIDKASRFVTGTFTFDAVDSDDSNIIYEVRNGDFRRVSYVIIN